MNARQTTGDFLDRVWNLSTKKIWMVFRRERRLQAVRMP